jgi:hypothetical protein
MAEEVFNGLIWGPDNNTREIGNGGVVNVRSGGVVNLFSGATLLAKSGATIEVASGGVLKADAGGLVDNGGLAAAVITVGAENTNVRAIGIQLNDAAGAAVTTRRTVQIAVLADANGDAFVATGGSTGIAIGTDGALLPIVAKKLFLAISEATGHIDLTWTDTGTEVAFLAVIVSGKMYIGATMANT